MEKFLRFLSGYVLILIEGDQAERFLNLCKSRGITIRRLCCGEDSCMKGCMSIDSFFKLRPIRRKTGVHIRVLEKHGFPFFFLRSKKRKAFFLGVLLCICLMAVLSSRIWNIHIEGNIKNSTPEILEFLEKEGIGHGIAKSKVNCSRIAASVRKQYPEITWVSAKMEGTRLILTIQEGDAQEKTAEEEPEPCSIKADVEGTIVKMVTRSGVPLFKPGDTCKKGDLLVVGRLDLKNDSQEVIRYEYVHADADIYVQRDLSYYEEFALEYEAEIPTGKSRKDFYIRLPGWYFQSGKTALEGWRRSVREYPLRITENFTLPVFFGKILTEEYQKVHSVYTEEQAKALARKSLYRFQEKLIEKGVSISANNVKIELNPITCIARGTLTVIEKTGTQTPVEMQEQPIERTAEDDQ